MFNFIFNDPRKMSKNELLIDYLANRKDTKNDEPVIIALTQEKSYE